MQCFKSPRSAQNKEEAPKRLQVSLFADRPSDATPLQKTDRISDHFCMQVSAVAIVHSSSPVNTGSSTFLPSMRSIMTEGAL